MFLKNDRILTAITLMLDIAFHAGRAGLVNGGEMARRNGLMRRGIEPLLHQLTQAGLLESVRGPKGGYRLGRSPRVITLHDIAASVRLARNRPSVPPATTAPPTQTTQTCAALERLVLAPLWQKEEAAVQARMAAHTLADLLQQAEQAGLQPKAEAVINFTI